MLMFGVPTPSQLDKINEKAKRLLSKEDVFVFSSKMVGDKLIENRYVKLDKSLLQVLKDDATEGVALMLDHPWAGLGRPKAAYPYGRTFEAKVSKGDIEGEDWALFGDSYIVRGREKDGLSTDAIIADIEDGTIFDVSIGFGYEGTECSICGGNIRECDHWPGRTYDNKICYVIAKPPGYLMELSLVFDGAYETAGVLSADGEITDSGLSVVRDYKSLDSEIELMNIYSKNRLITLARREDLERKIWKGGANMDDKKYTQEEVDAKVKEAVDAFKADLEKNAEGIDVFMLKHEAVEALGKEMEPNEVLKLAKEGMQYREELIEDTIAWGVRAEGEAFASDAWKQMLSEPTRTIEAIKAFRDQFKAKAEEIPAGRVTEPKPKEEKNEVPDEFYKV